MKKLISVLVVLSIVLSMLPTALAAPNVWDGSTAKSLTGAGTSTNPYLISTGAQLKLFTDSFHNTQEDDTYYVKFTNDIILNDGSFDSDGNFTKTGEQTFSAPKALIPAGKATWCIDGGGHYISGLYINSSDDGELGLFTYLYQGSYVKNFTIKNSYIGSTQKDADVGVLSGYAFRANVTDFLSENNIVNAGSGYATGGVCGWTEDSSLNKARTSGGLVVGGNIVGGIVGRSSSGTFKNCWNEAKVVNTESDYTCTGGIIGYSNANSVLNCANLGALSGGSYVGGIVGSTQSAIIKNCYSLNDIKDTTSVWRYNFDTQVGRYIDFAATICGTGTDVCDYCYAEDGYEFNDNGETGLVTHFTGKGNLGKGSDDELMAALNKNLYKLDGEADLLKWVKNANGYPIPSGSTFVDDAKYYNIWIDSVRICDKNEKDILDNGLASYDKTTNTLYLKDGLVITKNYKTNLLRAEGALNICATGDIWFNSDQKTGNTTVIDVSDILKIYAPSGETANVKITGTYAEYGIDAYYLTLDGNITLTINTFMPFASCWQFNLLSNTATLDANSIDDNQAMLNPFHTINLPETKPQALFEDRGNGLVQVDSITTSQKVGEETKPFMYSHFCIAPYSYVLAEKIPATLSVSMETANTSEALTTWVKAELNKIDGINKDNTTVELSDITPATAGTYSNQTGTKGSFTAEVKVTENNITFTRSIAGTITPKAYVAPTISTSIKVGTLTASGTFVESTSKSFYEGDKIVFAVNYKANGTDIKTLPGTVTCFGSTKNLAWNETNGAYLTAANDFTCPTKNSYEATFSIGETGEYSVKNGSLQMTVSEYPFATVTFDSNGGSLVENQTVQKGTAASAPSNPTQKGYIFGGWDLDGTVFNFNTQITADITLKALWTKCEHTDSTNVATCKDGAVCSVCGDDISKNPNNHSNLFHFSKVDSSVEAEGNIEYWYCDGCDKYYSDEKAENEIKLSDTIIAKAAPSITDGDNATITIGTRQKITITSNALLDDFIRVDFDGSPLDSANYQKRSGSTIITLNEDFVSTLTEGVHTIDIVSLSGTASATITVNANSEERDNPVTSDNASVIFVMICLMAIAIAELKKLEFSK